MLTQNDIINLRLKLAKQKHLQNVSDSVVLKSLITTDLSSQTKKEMRDGVDYYEGKPKISTRKIRYYLDGVLQEDKSKANNKATNAFHTDLVDQKSDYIAGNPVVISVDGSNDTENEEYQSSISEVLGEGFDDFIVDWIKNTSNKGVEWLHVYINSEGDFDYTLIPAEQIIAIYDSNYEKELISIIRYYQVEHISGNGESKKKYKAEWWDAEKVVFYVEDENGNYIIDISEDPNPRPHWIDFNTSDPEGTQEGGSWGRVPFVPLLNNSERLNDLRRVKSLIDIYDLVESDFANNLEDVQDVVMVLRGYDGESLKDFMTNLKKYKAIKVSAEPGSGVDQLTIEIPKEARDSLLDRLRSDIYNFGRGVDMSNEKFGNSPSGIALKFLYSGLDMKANSLIRKLHKALSSFVWFVTESINDTRKKEYKPGLVNFVFNKSILINESEKIQSARNSKGIISDGTIIENHPWVDNPEMEKKRIEADLEAHPSILPVE